MTTMTQRLYPKLAMKSLPPEALNSDNASDLSNWTHFQNCIDSLEEQTAPPVITNDDGEEIIDPRYEKPQENGKIYYQFCQKMKMDGDLRNFHPVA